MTSAREKFGSDGAVCTGAGTHTVLPTNSFVVFFALFNVNTLRKFVLFFSAIRHHESPLFTVYVAEQLAACAKGATVTRLQVAITAQTRTCLMRLTMAERVGFEPTVRFTRTTP